MVTRFSEETSVSTSEMLEKTDQELLNGTSSSPTPALHAKSPGRTLNIALASSTFGHNEDEQMK